MPISAFPSSVTIANAATESSSIDIAGVHNISIYCPAAWTAATLAVQVQRQGSSQWVTLCDGTGPIALPAAADRLLTLSGGVVIPNGAAKLRLVASVAQGAERVLPIELRTF